MGEVDDLFESTDASEDDFAVRQVGYENIRRLVTQLEDGLDYVDPDVCDDLAAALEWATATTTALINAEDEPQATATLDTILARYEAPGELPGTEWVDEHCESNISD